MEVSDIKPGVFILSKGFFWGDTYIIVRQLRDGRVIVARIASQKVYKPEKLLKKFNKISEEEFLARFGA